MGPGVAVLTASLNAAAATDGIVDPLLGRQVVAAGYDAWAGQESGIGSQTQMLAGSRSRSGPDAQAQVRIPPDSALDLGAVAKGRLADRLATIAHRSTGFDAIANMGGDLRVVSPSHPWVVSADPDIAGCAGHRHGDHRCRSGDQRSGSPILGDRTPHHRPADRTAGPHTMGSRSASHSRGRGRQRRSHRRLILAERGPDWLGAMGLDGWFVARNHEQAVGAWPRPVPVCA